MNITTLSVSGKYKFHFSSLIYNIFGIIMRLIFIISHIFCNKSCYFLSDIPEYINCVVAFHFHLFVDIFVFQIIMCCQ